jgi:argininosuccinate lyase
MTTTPEEFWRSHEHHFQGPGVPEDEERKRIRARLGTELQRVFVRTPALSATDMAWTVMLHKQGLVTTEVAAEVLKALESGEGAGEHYLKRELAGPDPSVEALEQAEDIAGVVNLGRTLQEPMSRLQQRDKLLDVLDLTIACLGILLDQAEAHVDTVMAGQTHLSHAQPTTYGAYLLAVHDALARSLEQIELAYRHTNQNSAGCGACSGTGWPVDRELITELLGLDVLVEATYDGEPGQDHALTILFAITNLGVILSRVAMDFNIWGMEEVMMVRIDPSWNGVSSLMPQKSIPGSEFERVRLEVSNVIGEMMTGVVSNKGEPYSDMLPIYEGYRGALRAMCHIEKALGFFTGLLGATTPDKERMLDYAREGFSATPDL